MSVFAERLKKARDDACLTQSELAKRCDVAQAAISQYETAQITPSFETLIKLARALRVSTDWLTGRAAMTTWAISDGG